MYSTAELHRLWSNAQPTDKKAETACIREKDLEREQEKWAREAEEEWKAQHTHTGRPDKRNETELEIEKRKERENILRRADEMMMEREQEIMRLNTLLLAAQCHAVQEDQKVLKKQMQKVTEAEEMRIHNLMEDERRRAIKKEEQKMALRRQQMVEYNTLISHSGFTKELEWLCDEQKKMQEIEDYRRAQTESPCVYFSREKRSMNDALTYEREKEERHRNEDHKYMQDKLRQPKKKSEEANIWEQRLRETMTKKLKYMNSDLYSINLGALFQDFQKFKGINVDPAEFFHLNSQSRGRGHLEEMRETSNPESTSFM
ncbi:CFA45 protein, partial [Polypterus senegalus]